MLYHYINCTYEKVEVLKINNKKLEESASGMKLLERPAKLRMFGNGDIKEE